MNDDLLDLIGKAVIKSRDEDTRVYWTNITPCLGLVSDTCHYLRPNSWTFNPSSRWGGARQSCLCCVSETYDLAEIENNKWEVHVAIEGFGKSLRYYDDDISFDENTNTMTYPDNGTETMPYIKWVMVMEACEKHSYLFVDSMWNKMDKIENKMMVFESRMFLAAAADWGW